MLVFKLNTVDQQTWDTSIVPAIGTAHLILLSKLDLSISERIEINELVPSRYPLALNKFQVLHGEIPYLGVA